MSNISKPTTFTSNTTISSSAVNDNFDTIYNEFNGGISSANIADNAVATAKIPDSAVTTDKLADGSVTNDKLAGGIGGAWQSWTPSYTNITVGNGTVSAKYIQIGKTVFYRFLLKMGTTTSVSNNPTMSPPIEAHADYNNSSNAVGTCMARDTSAANEHPGVMAANSPTQFQFIFADSNGSSLDSESFPFTEGNTDSLSATGSYEAA